MTKTKHLWQSKCNEGKPINVKQLLYLKVLRTIPFMIHKKDLQYRAGHSFQQD